MIHFDLPKQKSSIIKVIGVGGGGSNAVNYMFNETVEGVDFIICNTDAKAIEQSKVPNKIQLGPYLTQGLGAGANPEVGKKATEESLEEIKKILEVNTKMAFITAGMGGGTGTGGAPIIAKICRELGILTVGIVTTPFGFEGPRRLEQAKIGIDELTPHVDTLLVISNDKLRMQYGNLKMREAFGKADNILATAAKCITDIINSKGHIIVDFADVCTVMKNGGVAILGKAECEGEDRAQQAIEEALNSPLLNDSDIKGAKWILLNINSAEGDYECTMDESETILSYLRMQAGENSDVIVGYGTDASLDKKLSITLVATGFDSKNPFAKPTEAPKAEKKEEKIVMPLHFNFPGTEAAAAPIVHAVKEEEKVEALTIEQSIAPTLVEIDEAAIPTFNFYTPTVDDEPKEVVHFELFAEPVVAVAQPVEPVAVEPTIAVNEALQFTVTEKPILSKPTTIYSSYVPAVEEKVEPVKPTYAAPVFEFTVTEKEETTVAKEPEIPAFELVEKPVVPTVTATATTQAPVGDFDNLSEEEEQRRKAVERMNKLRNLSFKPNNEINSEFDEVPAYVRRKMDLFGNVLTTPENFYSRTTVSTDDNNNTHLSTLNSFLDGKKPD
jgi:cell division protein FtsZ